MTQDNLYPASFLELSEDQKKEAQGKYDECKEIIEEKKIKLEDTPIMSIEEQEMFIIESQQLLKSAIDEIAKHTPHMEASGRIRLMAVLFKTSGNIIGLADSKTESIAAQALVRA